MDGMVCGMSKWLMVFVVALVPAIAMAQENTPRFPQGTWTMQTYGSAVLGDAQPIVSGAFGGGYFAWNDISVNLDAYGYGVFNNSPDTGAIGMSLGLRNHHFHRDRWTIFSDVSGGVFEAFQTDVPPGGTRFNFTLRAGLGGTYEIKDNLHLIGGVRYFHLSNARIEGHEHNPNLNGVEVYMGLMWELGR